MKQHFFLVLSFSLGLIFSISAYSMETGKSRRINFTTQSADSSSLPTKIIEKSQIQARLQSSIPYVDLKSDKLKDDQVYQRVLIPDVESVGKEGLPERPFREELVRINPGTVVELVLDQIKWHDLGEDIHLAPVQLLLPDMRSPSGDSPDTRVPFVKDDTAYAINKFTSQNPVYLGERVRIRGREYITIIYDPVSYNPVQKQLRIAHEVFWHLDLQALPSVESIRSDLIRQETPDLLDIRLKDPNEVEIQSVPVDYMIEPDLVSGAADADYLIITADQFAEEIAPLAAWKHKKGFRTYVATLTEVGGTTETAIKTYISNAYASGRQTAFVLLVGDHENLPGASIAYHPYCSDSNVPFYSDLPYACVDGTDFYSDLVIARLPGDTESQITTMVNKILGYDKTPDMSNRYNHMMVAGMFEDDQDQEYTADRWFMEDLHRVADFLGPDYDFFASEISKGYTIHTAMQWVTNYSNSGVDFDPTTQVLHYRDASYTGRLTPPDPVPSAWKDEGSGTGTEINNAIADGIGFIIHRDHGYASAAGLWYDGLGWADPDYRTADVEALSNGTKLPFVFSLNCGTGHWEDRDAFAEAWMRNGNGGAVGFTGATRSSYSGPNDTFLVGLMDSFWDDYSTSPNSYGAVRTWPITFRPAEALTRAKAYVLATQGSTDTSYGTLTARLFNWFGDPEQLMRTKSPLTVTVTHPATLSVGNIADFNVSVTQGGAALQGAQVALVLDPGQFYVVTTDSSGQAHFNFTPDTSGTMSVTVSEQNSIPYEGTILLQNNTTPNIIPPLYLLLLSKDTNEQNLLPFFTNFDQLDINEPETITPLKSEGQIYDPWDDKLAGFTNMEVNGSTICLFADSIRMKTLADGMLTSYPITLF